MLSLQKIIVLFLVIVVILGVAYFLLFQNKTSKFGNIDNPYFNNALYSIPGTISVPNVSNVYLPYEGAIPAIDILRANNTSSAYYNQYLVQNITPFAMRL